MLPNYFFSRFHHSLVKDEMCETLWDSLKYLDTITELHFTHTLLGDGTAKALAELMITSLPNLRHLDLRNNQIGKIYLIVIRDLVFLD